MRLSVTTAVEADAAEIAALRNLVSQDLTLKHGVGPWSKNSTERGALRDLRESQIVIVRRATRIVGSLCLSKKKPWAIDVSYFTQVNRPIYLLSMNVEPKLQRQGVGRCLLDAAKERSRKAEFQAIRLDAFDARAGAEGFYRNCGYCEVGRVTYRKAPLVYFELVL
jgi:ribosomal protein S18 acetylase RimI-like enzyme